MKAFLRKILPQRLVNRYIKYQEYQTVHYLKKEDIAYVYRKKHGLEKQAAAIETVAIRGSNTDRGFFPSCINHSYNLGLISSDVYSNYYLYLKLREMLPNLKNIVYFVNGFINGMSLIRIAQERYRAVSYKYFFDIPYQDDRYIDKKIEEKIFKKCKKIKVNVPDDYLGYEIQRNFIVEMDAKLRAKKITRENRREPDQMIWLQKTIEQIIEDKKNIFIVIVPYSEKLKECLPPKEELYQKTYSLLSNYSDFPNVQLIDLYDSKAFDDSDMEDNDHFNQKGAQKCTTIIKEYMSKT
ncbi:hypothetical protein FACS1894145_5400 [Bacteroidia bacterium]|nr:hypothetical protein FACS1894145_5400 [Bacteroidia bacterium]